MHSVRDLANLVETRSSTAATFLTFRGLIRERPAKGYVSLLFNPGRVYSDRLAGREDVLGWSFRAVCVGYDDDQVLFVVERFRPLFVGWQPLGTPGPRFNEADDDAPVLKDDSVDGDTRYSTILRYTLTT